MEERGKEGVEWRNPSHDVQHNHVEREMDLRRLSASQKQQTLADFKLAGIQNTTRVLKDDEQVLLHGEEERKTIEK